MVFNLAAIPGTRSTYHKARLHAACPPQSSVIVSHSGYSQPPNGSLISATSPPPAGSLHTTTYVCAKPRCPPRIRQAYRRVNGRLGKSASASPEDSQLPPTDAGQSNSVI